MKNLFTIFLCVLAFVLSVTGASAQSSSSLVLDAASLTPVNVDAVTGLALDPIVKDRSNRPCARIKLHVNRMTPEEIRDMEVRAIGGNVLVMKQQLAQEGNGLIIELTARPETRIYLHHDKYGDSNPVALALEGNREYRMEAWNETRLSIAVSFADAGSEVYLDDTFRGYIGDNNLLTIADVSMGNHDLSLRYSDGEYSTRIHVSPADIFFYIDPSVTMEDVETESIEPDVEEPLAEDRTQEPVEAEEPEEEILPLDDASQPEESPVANEIAGVEIEDDSKDIESAIEQVMVKDPVKGNMMIMASLGVFPQMSYGAMLGYVKKVGPYVKFRSNYDFSETSYNCTSDGKDGTGYRFYASGNPPRYIRHQATAGLLVRLSKNIYPYVGVGYGLRSVHWEDYLGNWAKVADYSCQGIAAEAGMTFKLGSFSLSAGASTTSFKYTDLEIGVGFMF